MEQNNKYQEQHKELQILLDEANHTAQELRARLEESYVEGSFPHSFLHELRASQDTSEEESDPSSPTITRWNTKMNAMSQNLSVSEAESSDMEIPTTAKELPQSLPPEAQVSTPAQDQKDAATTFEPKEDSTQPKEELSTSGKDTPELPPPKEGENPFAEKGSESGVTTEKKQVQTRPRKISWTTALTPGRTRRATATRKSETTLQSLQGPDNARESSIRGRLSEFKQRSAFYYQV